jgi:peptide subunit release factor 1 (eRF1)
MAVKDQLDRLAAFEPAPYPVVSLYLNTQPGQTGRDQFESFVRKEFAARSRTYEAGSPERESLDTDLERITQYLNDELDPAANGVALFACSAGELFETIQMTAPIERHWLSIADRPSLYPLARIESLHPRYAAVLADTNAARIMVFATGEVVAAREIRGVKTKRTSQGGWSQARYQRHIENFHVQHAKDVIDALDKIVQQENIAEIIIAGDEVVMPLLREQMPKHLSEKVVEHVRMNLNTPEQQLIESALDAMTRVRSQTEREKVEAAVGGFRSGGLGVVGPQDTLEALIKGQVDELLITASLRELQPVGALRRSSGRPEPGSRGGLTQPTASDSLEAVLPEPVLETVAAGEPAEARTETVRLADELITKAAQTGARITFVKDPELLKDYGGVAAILRFSI